jgi:hypothetical protein
MPDYTCKKWLALGVSIGQLPIVGDSEGADVFGVSGLHMLLALLDGRAAPEEIQLSDNRELWIGLAESTEQGLDVYGR